MRVIFKLDMQQQPATIMNFVVFSGELCSIRWWSNTGHQISGCQLLLQEPFGGMPPINGTVTVLHSTSCSTSVVHQVVVTTSNGLAMSL
jgi:hypothetical protein